MKLKTKENTVKLSHKRDNARLSHVAKKSMKNRLTKREKEKQYTSAESQAIDTVQSASKELSYETRYQIKRFAGKRLNKRKQDRFEKQNDLNVKTNSIDNTKRYISNTHPISSKQNKNKVQELSKQSIIQKVKGQTPTTISNTFYNITKKAEEFIVSSFASVKSFVVSSNHLLLFGIISISLVVVILFGMFGLNGSSVNEEPNFYNLEAYVYENPYAQADLYGQCTWFAWGRFYELYGYDPGFRGDGWECAQQLVESRPDKWKLSDTPTNGSVFSGVDRNHVGIVLKVEGDVLTIQEGNLDGKTNTFEEAIKDWHTITITLNELIEKNKGIVFAIRI